MEVASDREVKVASDTGVESVKSDTCGQNLGAKLMSDMKRRWRQIQSIRYGC